MIKSIGNGMGTFLGFITVASLLSGFAFLYSGPSDNSGSKVAGQRSLPDAMWGGAKVWAYQHAHPLWAYLGFAGPEKSYHHLIGEGNGVNSAHPSSEVEELRRQREQNLEHIKQLQEQARIQQAQIQQMQQTTNTIMVIAALVIIALGIAYWFANRRIKILEADIDSLYEPEPVAYQTSSTNQMRNVR